MRLAVMVLCLLAVNTHGAGGVIGEPGSCMIEIGLYSAHFSIYQPEGRGNEVFCEDLPDAAEALFVMDYLHGSMREVGVDFRIIRDTEDWGIFARWENVQGIDNIDERTVFYQEPTVRADNKLQVEYRFEEPGAYIGIVTAPHPSKDIVYHAVFPFEVGGSSMIGWILLLVVLAALALYLLRRKIK